MTTCRTHGHSLPPFDSLNLGDHVGDNPVLVEKNRQKIITTLGCPSQPVWLNQTHSNNVVHADHYKHPTPADASFTQTPGLVLAIMTGDCLPIVLFHPKPHTLAVIHAGWRGLANGLIEKTIAQMPKPHHDIYAWLGPCISQEAYPVGDECIQAWTDHEPSLSQALIEHQNQTYASLTKAATITLRHQEIIHIDPTEYCTYQMAYSFFSHRRDKGNTGRMATLAWLGSN